MQRLSPHRWFVSLAQKSCLVRLFGKKTTGYHLKQPMSTYTAKEETWKQPAFKYYVLGGTLLILVLPGCCLYLGYLLSKRSLKISLDPQKYKTEASWYLAVAHYIVVETGPCFLITQEGRGINARIVDPLEPERGLEKVYFASNPNTRKISEIERNPRVCLAFYLPGQISYVVLHGVSKVIRDASVKKHFWKPAWNFFYPQGPEGNDCVIVQVLVDRIELISHEHGINPSWKAAILTRDMKKRTSWELVQK
ncbi:hypothetical protein GAYE_SCF48G5996 [Galdieria yellowstonensis]|uniref:General stress protein FMN-binding split barrel domain-containing protein n=1 Tax=Galdieria yellowstonensis TaxID=3028027 RepID=A0AAV9ILC2_9RHOD|nr:hypothetical protein GAYE_SCF48G5996 [Galdieria yellowstonensis]